MKYLVVYQSKGIIANAVLPLVTPPQTEADVRKVEDTLQTRTGQENVVLCSVQPLDGGMQGIHERLDQQGVIINRIVDILGIMANSVASITRIVEKR